MKRIFIITLFISLFTLIGCKKDEDGKRVQYEIYEETIEGEVRQFVNFGSYPQTIVTNEGLIDNLNGLDSEPNGYYLFDTVYYAKCTTDIYKTTEYNNGKDAVHNQIAYFKVEPIKWELIDGKLISTKVLNAEKFDRASTSFNNSDIEKFLNNSFLNNFSSEEQNTIKKVDGNKVNLLSNTDINDLEKKTKATDYTIANFCKVDKLFATYWIKTNNSITYVSEEGEVLELENVNPNLKYIGVRPTITLY